MAKVFRLKKSTELRTMHHWDRAHALVEIMHRAQDN
jgi:hypothetical protein